MTPSQNIHILSDYSSDALEHVLYNSILMQQFPNANFLLSYQPAFKKGDMMAPGFYLKLLLSNLPQQCMHFCILHIESKLPEKYTAAKLGNSIFFAPDNGMLPIAFGDLDVTYYKLPLPNVLNDVVQQIYLPAAIAWAENGDSAFETEDNPKKFLVPSPAFTNNTFRLTVLFNDSHGNAYVNMEKDEFTRVTEGKKFNIKLGMRDNINQISNSYHEVPEGYKLALFGLGDMLQIAVNCGSAAQYYGLKTGQQLMLQIE